jgi:integrase
MVFRLHARRHQSGWLPLDCKPHGLRKTLGRHDAGASAHEIMAALGHTTLAEAERYTREAARRRGGRAAVTKLERSKHTT